MRKYLFGLDVVLGVLLLLAVVIQVNGCNTADVESARVAIETTGNTVQAIAPVVATAAPALLAAGSALGWPAWILLILNIVSSTAAAIVAGRKKSVIE